MGATTAHSLGDGNQCSAGEGASVVTDIELARALEDGRIDKADFKHFHHLHVAWVYLAESNSIDQATARMGATLRKFAAANKVPAKYHQTVTAFWMRILALLQASDQRFSLDDWVALKPQLLEKTFSLRYYSRERLFSETARESWVEPDLRSLPTNASEVCSSSPTGDASHRNLSQLVTGK
jgi:hypothetical protein